MNREGNGSKATKWTTNMTPGQRLNSWQGWVCSIEMQNKHPVWLDRLKCAHPQQRNSMGLGGQEPSEVTQQQPALVFISRDQNFRIPSDLTIPCCRLYNIPPESQGWSSHKILVISPAYPHKSHSSLTLTMKGRLVSLSSRNIHTCFFKGRAKWWLTQPSWKGPHVPQKTGSSHLHLESHLSRRKSNV